MKQLDVIKNETISLKQRIIEYIYSAIINEELRHGDQIKEKHIAEKFNISRAPAREAMFELVSLGILEHKPKRGTFVKNITSKEIYDTYEAKGIIEGFLASFYPLYATQNNIDKLDEYILKMTESKNDTKKVVKIGELFHKETIKYANNNTMLDMLEKINKRSQILFLKNWTKLYTLDEIIYRHEKIVLAIKSKDRKKTENVVREHYFETGSKLVLLREVQRR